MEKRVQAPDDVRDRGSDERSLYIDLLQRVVSNVIFADKEMRLIRDLPIWDRLLLRLLRRPTAKLMESAALSDEAISKGLVWSSLGLTMIGTQRLQNLRYCLEHVIEEGIPGDLIETGVWRGGATIFMRAILKAFAVTDRCVWVADSFEGLPRPNKDKYPADANDRLYAESELAISLDEVQRNFARFGLLDAQVKFLKGWFRDTLPSAPIASLSLIRLDGDMYESTMDGLVHLYPKLSTGGYLIVDDFGAIPACRQAVEDFRSANKIAEDIKKIDWTGVYWRKEVAH
jgi:O-methyltransferase